MKLLIVIPYYWPSFIHGGPIFSLYCLSKALVRKGVDVTVYTTNVNLGRKVPLNREIDIDRVKVNYFSYSRFFEFIAPFGWQFSCPLTRALKERLESFDLIYIATVWSYPAVIAAYYSMRYKKQYVVAPRGMLYPEVFFKKIWKKWLFYKLFVEKALKQSSAIHYTSEDEARKTNYFLNLNNRMIVVPNGIELSEFQAPANSEGFKIRYPQLKDKKVILFLGRLNWKKGLDILIKAYTQLIKERHDVHLLIVGPDEKGYIKKIKRWIGQCGMNYKEHVTFTGMLTGEEKLEAYRSSDIFILPSYSENFGMTILEALAMGLAVVVSDKVGICSDIERNRAGIVIDTQVESAYKAMKILLENSDLRRELSINGRKLAQDCYDIDKVADKMIASFKEILG